MKLRILRKPVNEVGGSFWHFENVLQYFADNHGWMDVPIVEDHPTGKE